MAQNKRKGQMLKIRKAAKPDLIDILKVEAKAFGAEKGPEIQNLVTGLLDDPTAVPQLSLIALEDMRAIGHILFTKARIAAKKPVAAALLAPLAVIPEARNRGVGGLLIQEGLRLLPESGAKLVFVLGYPDYYGRHGFKPAAAHGFEAPYPISAEHADAWMVQELEPGFIGRVSGTVLCADVLNQPKHWRE